MKNEPFMRKADILDQFKQTARRNEPALIDFSERIMSRIAHESGATGRERARVRRRGRAAYLAGAVVLSVLLLSGFTYAAYEGLLFLKDRYGNTVMQVNSTNWEVPEEHQRIMDSLKARLNPGESAVIVFGRKAIDAVKRGEPPQSTFTVVRGKVFPSVQALAPHLRGALAGMQMPADVMQGATLFEAELVPEAGTSVIPEPDRWIEASDAETGEPYAYQIGNASETAKFATFRYRDGETVYELSIGSSSQPTLQFYDSRPSKDQIEEIAGIQVYHYKNKSENILIWSRQTENGSFVYFLKASPANDEKQKAFAEAVISSYR